MNIRVVRHDLGRTRADVAACFAYEGDREPRGVDDPLVRKALAHEMRASRFGGLASDLVTWNGARGGPRKLLVVGLGRERAEPDGLRAGSARVARAAARLGAESLAIRLPGAGGPATAAEDVRVSVEGAILGAYHFERHLSEGARRVPRLRSLEISLAGSSAAFRGAVRLGEIGSRAVCLARDLVNEGPSRKGPVALARYAAAVARASGLACRVRGPAELRRLGIHALLAVARGSDQPARVVHLRYRPRGKPHGRVVLVGKGVTFDSGGLNLKPTTACSR